MALALVFDPLKMVMPKKTTSTLARKMVRKMKPCAPYGICSRSPNVPVFDGAPANDIAAGSRAVQESSMILLHRMAAL